MSVNMFIGELDYCVRMQAGTLGKHVTINVAWTPYGAVAARAYNENGACISSIVVETTNEDRPWILARRVISAMRSDIDSTAYAIDRTTVHLEEEFCAVIDLLDRHNVNVVHL